MTRISFHVWMDVEGDADDMGRCFEQYLTVHENPFLADYHRDGENVASMGYDGPFVSNVVVERRS